MKSGKKVVFPRSFTRAYPDAIIATIDPENIADFLLPKKIN